METKTFSPDLWETIAGEAMWPLRWPRCWWVDEWIMLVSWLGFCSDPSGASGSAACPLSKERGILAVVSPEERDAQRK